MILSKQLIKLISAITAGICLFGANTCNSIPNSVITANAADYMDKGEVDGYVYDVWNNNYTGTVEYENSDTNGFTASWEEIHNFAVTKGKSFEKNTVSAYQFKECKVRYDLDITPGGSEYVGVRGWFTHPDTLFNIVEAWGSWRPPGNVDAISTVTVDGTNYDIYRENSNTGFDASNQYKIYWSVARREPLELGKSNHIDGTIDALEHFKAWSSVGLDLGFIYDVKFDLEAYRSSGSAKLNSLDITYDIADESVFGKTVPVRPYEEHDPLPVDIDGKIIKVDFESENDKVGVLGAEASAVISGDRFYSETHSMYITQPSELGEAAFFYELDPYDLPESKDISGSYYQTGARIFNNSKDDVSFEVQLVEYTDEPLTYNLEIKSGSRVCKSGQWTNISDLLFTFSHDVFHKYRVVFIPSAPVDYYVDDFYIASGDPEFCVGIQKFEPDVRGDLNGDGVVNSFDVIECRKAIINSMGVNRIETSGDVNGDFRSNISDLVLLTKYVLNISQEIPLPDDEAVLLLGDHSDSRRDGQRCIYVSSNNYNDDRLRTVFRNDGSFNAEWSNVSYYTCENYEDYTESDKRKSSKDFDINYSADIKAENFMDLVLRGTISQGNRSLRFFIHEGGLDFSELDYYEKTVLDESNFTIVTLNGNEYYMKKDITREDTLTGMTETDIEFFRKGNQIKTNESCHLENSLNLEEVMGYWSDDHETKDQVKRIGMYIDTHASSGYADFNELKFS